MADLGLTRAELIDVALLDVVADVGKVPLEALLLEVHGWLADHEAWSPDVWPLIESLPDAEELEERLGFLARLGMVRLRGDRVEITLAGEQMCDGFPWEYFAEEDDDDEE